MTGALYAAAGFALGNWLPILVIALPLSALALLASKWARRHRWVVIPAAIVVTAAVLVFNLSSLRPEPFLQRTISRLAPTQPVAAECTLIRADYGFLAPDYASYACSVSGICALPVEMEVAFQWSGDFRLPEELRLDEIFAPGCIGGRLELALAASQISG